MIDRLKASEQRRLPYSLDSDRSSGYTGALVVRVPPREAVKLELSVVEISHHTRR